MKKLKNCGKKKNISYFNDGESNQIVDRDLFMKTHPLVYDSHRRDNGNAGNLEYVQDFRRATMADNDCISPEPIKGSKT